MAGKSAGFGGKEEVSAPKFEERGTWVTRIEKEVFRAGGEAGEDVFDVDGIDEWQACHHDARKDCLGVKLNGTRRSGGYEARAGLEDGWQKQREVESPCSHECLETSAGLQVPGISGGNR